jgi:hypothetical protein
MIKSLHQDGLGGYYTIENRQIFTIPHKGFVYMNIMAEHDQRYYKDIEVKGVRGKSSKGTLETSLPMAKIPNQNDQRP